MRREDEEEKLAEILFRIYLRQNFINRRIQFFWQWKLQKYSQVKSFFVDGYDNSWCDFAWSSLLSHLVFVTKHSSEDNSTNRINTRTKHDINGWTSGILYKYNKAICGNILKICSQLVDTIAGFELCVYVARVCMSRAQQIELNRDLHSLRISWTE